MSEKAVVAPVYFDPGRDDEFDEQLARLRQMLGDLVEFAEPVALGNHVGEVDAVIFPQILGEAYRQAEAFQAIDVPILIITSEFGTLQMWDWEIKSYLSSKGVTTIAPYSLEDSRKVCQALNARREMRSTKFLIFQDNPGEGFQASIFKRFFWWEQEATDLLGERFGLTVVRKSFKELGARAGSIPDADAEGELLSKDFPHSGLSTQSLLSAVKLYMAVREELDADPSIRGVGINCLNESHFSDTTPCLAWDLHFTERRILWACEGDTITLATKYIIHKSLGVPLLMSNIYPFVMGNAALKHERIPSFPEIIEEPDNHLLLAHCGYLGVCPRCFARKGRWVLKPKVLAIVDENAHAIDADMNPGPCTLAKLDPSMTKLMVIEAENRGYVQYADSDLLNGAVIRVPDGHRLMRNVYSHHQLLVEGHIERDLLLVGDVFGIEIVSA